MKIKFMLDYTESPFWSIDEEAKSLYGYNIDLKSLDLQERTIVRVKSITKLYYQRLNSVYQMFPSFWSGRMNMFYQMFLNQVYSEIEEDVSDKIELINDEIELMNQKIDIKGIDNELTEFLNAPSKYADDKGVTYKSRNKLKEEIEEAYRKWETIENQWTTI